MIRPVLGLVSIVPLALIMFTVYSLLGDNIDFSSLVYSEWYNTFIYLSATITLCLFLGGGLSYVVTKYEFPFRKAIEKLHILPMVFPTYVLAVLYSDMNNWFYSIYGLIFVTVLCTYSFVYILMYSSFISLDREYEFLFSNYRYKRFSLFFKVYLPLLKTSIVTSVFLVVADVLNEFGASYYLGVDTLIVSLYEQYYVLGNMDYTLTVSLILVAVILTMYAVKYNLKTVKMYNPLVSKYETRRIQPKRPWLVTIITAIPLVLGFFIPMYGVIESYITIDYRVYGDVIGAYFNSVGLLSLVCIFLMMMTYTILLTDSKIAKTVLTSYYIVPSMILSIFVMMTINYYNWTYGAWLLLTVYSLKYFTMMYTSVESKYKSINKDIYLNSSNYGVSKFWVFKNVVLRYTRNNLLLGMTFVSIEIARELPLILAIRPLGLETVSLKMFYYMDTELPRHGLVYMSGLVMFTLALLYLYYKLEKGHK